MKSKRNEKIMQWMKDKILLLFHIVSKSQYFKFKKSLTSWKLHYYSTLGKGIVFCMESSYTFYPLDKSFWFFFKNLGQIINEQSLWCFSVQWLYSYILDSSICMLYLFEKYFFCYKKLSIINKSFSFKILFQSLAFTI